MISPALGRAAVLGGSWALLRGFVLDHDDVLMVEMETASTMMTAPVVLLGQWCCVVYVYSCTLSTCSSGRASFAV